MKMDIYVTEIPTFDQKREKKKKEIPTIKKKKKKKIKETTNHSMFYIA